MLCENKTCVSSNSESIPGPALYQRLSKDTNLFIQRSWVSVGNIDSMGD